MKQRQFNHVGNAYAQSAERQFAELNKAIRGLRDNMNGLHRALHVPRPKGGRRYTKSVRDNLSIFEKAGESSIGNFLGKSINAGLGLSSGGSFYQSSSQAASLFTQMLQQGQRIL
jgi:hypothetical protein